MQVDNNRKQLTFLLHQYYSFLALVFLIVHYKCEQKKIPVLGGLWQPPLQAFIPDFNEVMPIRLKL